jgi:F1F0 ATPase subunit 2
MLNETFNLVMALVAGIFLGVIFFGGLWWTVQKMVSSKPSVLWFLASFMLRMSLVLVGFYFISGGQWRQLLLCLFGFVIARFIVLALTRSQSRQGCNHAP